MPKSSKKAAKVEAAAVVPTPTKALKKRKRKAEEAIEKQVVSTNKQRVVKKMTRPSEEELSKAATEVVSSSEDESDEEEEKPAKTPKTDNDVIRTEVAKTSTPKTPSTQQSGGSKTLFMGNLSYLVEKAEVKNFFGSTGEVVDIQWGISMDGNSFRNYAYVEFATSEEAEKAMELNGEMLMGRQIKLKFPRESSSLQGRTAFVSGFDTMDGEEEIMRSLVEHFDACGVITRLYILKNGDGDVKGMAYIDFLDSNALAKALDLSGSVLGNQTLFVDEAQRRVNYGYRSGKASAGSLRAASRNMCTKFYYHLTPPQFRQP